MSATHDDNDKLKLGIIDGGTDPFDDSMPEGVTWETAADVFDGYLKRLDLKLDGTIGPIKTPWRPVNKALAGGMRPGFYVLVGDTGSGKTQMAVQMAFHAAQNRIPVLYIALELDRDGLAARFISCLGDSPHWSDFYAGGRLGVGGDFEPRPELRSIAQDRIKSIEGLPLHLSFPNPYRFSPEALCREIVSVRARFPSETPDIPETRPLLVVLDFLQIMGPNEEQRETDLRNRVSNAAYAAVEDARTQGATLLMLSTTARSNYHKIREAHQTLASGSSIIPATLVGFGKESGEIESGGTGVMVICRTGDPEDKDAHLVVAKQRHGPSGIVPMSFTGTAWSERANKSNEVRRSI